MNEELKKIINDERGATLLEYVGLAVLLLIGVWVAATNLGTQASSRLKDIQDKLK